jgi:hypothetical protein
MHRVVEKEGPPQRHGSVKRGPRVAIVSAGGGFGAQVTQLVRRCPEEVDLILLCPPHLVPRDERLFADKAARIVRIGWGSRLRRSDGWIRHLLLAPQGFMSAFQHLRATRPDWVIVVAQRYSLYVLLCARLLRIRSIFIDSLTRVNRPSVTGRIVARLRLADHTFCQWPNAAAAIRGVEYAGRLL